MPSRDQRRGLPALAEALDIGLTVVGPEAPLVSGVVDRFRAAGKAIVGPTASAARLEGSKSFSKDFMIRAGIRRLATPL
jgi:phosphoribosylamine--glycine ligase